MIKSPRKRPPHVVLFIVLLTVAVFSPPSASLATEDEFANSLGMKFRLLKAGRFEMGEHDLAPVFYKDHSGFSIADTRPVHPVVLTKPFYLATTEVTVRQFRQFVQQTGYSTSAEKNQRGAVGWDPTPPADNPRYLATFRDNGGFSWKKPGFAQSDDHPVTCVSYEDAKAFCAWLSKKEDANYRLPTEAEWEYAARAGAESPFFFGDGYRGVIQRFANIGNVELERAFPDRVRRQWLVDVERDPPDRHVFTAPGGSYRPNPWGLYDMYGNVWEWCEDRYLDTAYKPYTRPGHEQLRRRAIDPLNLEKWGKAGDWRVIRGGSWFNAPIQCRSSGRGFFEAGDAACYLGFRVALDPAKEVVKTARRKFEHSEAARTTLKRLADRVRERRDGRLTVELNQQRQPLTDQFLKALQQLDEPLDLHLHGPLTRDQIAAIAQAPRLAGFLVSGVGPDVTDDDFAPLAKHGELELLRIVGASRLTDTVLLHFQNLDRLEQLELDAPGITDKGLESLPPLKHLNSLKLRGTSSQGIVLRRLSRSPLRTFSCSRLTDEGALLLARFRELRDISIAQSPITGRGLRAISQLPYVSRLFLSDCRELRDADFAVVGDLYNLTSLGVDGTSAGDRAVGGIARLNYVRDLNIGSENLSDAGVRKICSLVSLHHLTLNAEAKNLTDAALTDLWRLANLRSLTIAAPRITGSGLATLHELPRLEHVNLNSMGVTDAALKHAARSETLRHIFIGSWEHGGPPALTDAGMMHLGNSQSLQKVDLLRRNTKVSDEGLERLRAKRSELSVNIR